MMQGDEYKIPFEIEIDGFAANGENVADVEISIGNITKTMSSGAITFDAEQGAFLFPITQNETFSLRNTPQKVQVRVKDNQSNVQGIQLENIDVVGSVSKAVI